MPARAKNLKAGPGGGAVELTNVDKLLFPGEKITKGEFISYYEKIADTMLPHLRGRLISMQRFPGGVSDNRFFQKQAPEYFPQWVMEKNRAELAEVAQKADDTAFTQKLIHFWNWKRWFFGP